MNTSTPHPFIKWFADITIDDVPLVGGKNASLGEMVRELAGKGVKVPDGFAITAEAFRHFIREAGIVQIALTKSTSSQVANTSSPLRTRVRRMSFKPRRTVGSVATSSSKE